MSDTHRAVWAGHGGCVLALAWFVESQHSSMKQPQLLHWSDPATTYCTPDCGVYVCVRVCMCVLFFQGS